MVRKGNEIAIQLSGFSNEGLSFFIEVSKQISRKKFQKYNISNIIKTGIYRKYIHIWVETFLNEK